MKTLVCFVHLLSACLAVGSVLLQDYALYRNLGKRLKKKDVIELTRAMQVISLSLIALWLSGIALVTLGYLAEPETYLTNQKLWAKVLVVAILTINGMALHRVVFPQLKAGTELLRLRASEFARAVFFGAISTVSWLFACYLGIARPWNYSLELFSILQVYGLIIAMALTGGVVIFRLSARRYN